MDNSSRAMRVLAGAWVLLGLIGLFKLGLVITGQYTVNWSQELGLMMPIVITSAATKNRMAHSTQSLRILRTSSTTFLGEIGLAR